MDEDWLEVQAERAKRRLAAASYVLEEETPASTDPKACAVCGEVEMHDTLVHALKGTFDTRG